MVKRVSIIAYYFPSMHGSSGMLRILHFTQYLPDHGWDNKVISGFRRRCEWNP